MRRLRSVLFWSVLPAAFIGPGTVATCGKAGASYGFALLWALLFATVACIALQETAARVAAASGRDLGGAIAMRFGEGRLGRAFRWLVASAIFFGCAAYQRGNLIGATEGATLATGLDRTTALVVVVALAAALLWRGAPRLLARLMGLVVAFMGLAFLGVAVAIGPDWSAVLRGAVVPTVPEGGLIVAVGLVGTTVVPYNLFLGGALAKGKALSEVRFGTVAAVSMGVLISGAIVVAGTAVVGTFSYALLGEALSERLGSWAGPLFDWGLCAAGFTSAITAPLAAGLTVEGTLGRGSNADRASPRERVVRLVVLGIGFAFALANVNPVPAVIAAQALNGVVLPLVAAFLVIVANDRRVVGDSTNGVRANVLGGLVVFTTTGLGASYLAGAVANMFGRPAPDAATLLAVSAAVASLTLFAIRRAVVRGAERVLPVE